MEFLVEALVPALQRSKESGLARAIRRSVMRGRLDELARLPERQRRELLERVERRLDKGRRGPSPRSIVRLTTVLAAAPEGDLPYGRRFVSPPR